MALTKTSYRKICIAFLIDIVCIFLSLVFGILLGQGNTLDFSDYKIYILLEVNIPIIFGLNLLLHLYRFSYKMAGLHEAIKIVMVSITLLLANIVFSLLTRESYISYSQIFIYIVLLTNSMGGYRFIPRIYTSLVRASFKHRKGLNRVLIIGAGEAGNQLSREILNSNKVNYYPVAFLDDDISKVGESLNGIKVVGTTQDLSFFVKKYAVDEIFIAMPSAKKRDIKRIYEQAKETNLPVKALPGVFQLINGDVSVTNLKPVEITDLLGREEVKVNIDEIIKYISGEVVLVTGGGGSIGSELCRQIAHHNPKQLIIFDIYENNVYDIEQELKRTLPDLNLLTLIGSIRDSSKLKDVFEKYHPTIVFNAAAHKHVPLMETSPNEAIKNNSIGTLKLARVADEYKAKTFVQISTDKAVNPTNIMGASKRICEMIIQTIGRHSKHTNFVAVRFGNVLGSNGSVIPLFKKQIAAGGPVTITDMNITRYFMTIPEAVSLVLEAGAYAKKGQIFVLDMGEPVKIYDLAVNLIKLSGLKPGVDIEIKEIGLRPGEKLYEERLMDEEGLEKTANGLISIAKPIQIEDEDKFFKDLDKLYELAYQETDKMKELVAELVPTYTVDKRD